MIICFNSNIAHCFLAFARSKLIIKKIGLMPQSRERFWFRIDMSLDNSQLVMKFIDLLVIEDKFLE